MAVVEDSVGLDYLRLQEGSQVFGEMCEKSHMEGKPAILEKFERDKFILVIAFNDPRETKKPSKATEAAIQAANTSSGIPPPPVGVPAAPGSGVPLPPASGVPPPPASGTHSVTFDLRKSLGELRSLIGGELKLPENTFKIRKARFGPELKDSKKSLAAYNFSPPCSVWLDEGKPLSKGEFILRLCADIGEKGKELKEKKGGESPFVFVSEIKLNATMTIKQVKENIRKVYKEGPEPAYMRLRALKSENKLGDLFFDDKTLIKNRPGMRDYENIVVQKTAIPEKVKNVLRRKAESIEILHDKIIQACIGPATTELRTVATIQEAVREMSRRSSDNKEREPILPKNYMKQYSFIKKTAQVELETLRSYYS
ncbi:hypothetical protein AAMO2058_000984600 [Amorphochlora amoebiformis]